MVILGLDPGTAATGWGVVEVRGATLRALAWDVVRTKPVEEPAARLGQIHRRVEALLGEYAVDAVAVEELYVGANPRTILGVGQARGAALAACGTRGIPVGEYTPSVIKTAVCGYGRAEKGQVAQMVRAILALDAPPTPDHAADALAAAVCHAQHARRPAAVAAARGRR